RRAVERIVAAGDGLDRAATGGGQRSAVDRGETEQDRGASVDRLEDATGGVHRGVCQAERGTFAGEQRALVRHRQVEKRARSRGPAGRLQSGAFRNVCLVATAEVAAIDTATNEIDERAGNRGRNGRR